MQSPEVFSNDAYGNVTNDGRWTFIWDAENQLVSMVGPASVSGRQQSNP